MKSICFFSSYYTNKEVPYYVKFYLEELAKHFTEVVFITTEKEFPASDTLYFSGHSIQVIQVRNEGFDFGMWNKAFGTYDILSYDRIGLVNDSCILFGKLSDFFNWVEKDQPDFCGFTESYLLGYHLQSYFLVINSKAIPYVLDYFNKTGLVKEINEVIKLYEVGLSKFLADKGMRIKSYFTIPEKGAYNYALFKGKNLIQQGFPLVKKKIITRQYVSERWWSMVVMGFDPFPTHYIKMIMNNYQVPDELFTEFSKNEGWGKSLRFHMVSYLAIALRVLRRFMRK